MCCENEIKQTTRIALMMGILLLILGASSPSPCPPCGFGSRWSEEDADMYEQIPAKKDIFMSRGWGAGGGQAFPSRANVDLSKKTRVIDMLINDEDLEANPQPRTAFLRAPAYVPRTDIPRRQHPAHVPQLFISSGWGPLGK